jgi:hypothetical protein
MAKENLMLYFRGAGITDEDDDDGIAAGTGVEDLTSLMIPASKLRAIVPGGSTSTIKMYFDSVRNWFGDDGTATEITTADYVILTVTAGKLREAMTDVIQAINGYPHDTGFLVIADDVTTNVAGNTVAAEYVSQYITGIAANNIQVLGPHNGS